MTRTVSDARNWRERAARAAAADVGRGTDPATIAEARRLADRGTAGALVGLGVLATLGAVAGWTAAAELLGPAEAPVHAAGAGAAPRGLALARAGGGRRARRMRPRGSDRREPAAPCPCRRARAGRGRRRSGDGRRPRRHRRRRRVAGRLRGPRRGRVDARAAGASGRKVLRRLRGQHEVRLGEAGVDLLAARAAASIRAMLARGHAAIEPVPIESAVKESLERDAGPAWRAAWAPARGRAGWSDLSRPRPRGSPATPAPRPSTGWRRPWRAAFGSARDPGQRRQRPRRPGGRVGDAVRGSFSSTVVRTR